MSYTSRPVCAAILGAQRGGFDAYKHPSLASLEVSARCGCHYCSAVCEFRPEIAKKDIVGVRLLEKSLWVSYHEHSDMEIFTLSTQNDPMIPQARQISGDTGSRQSFETIRGWLDTCMATHKSFCSTPRDEEGYSRLPDRVIEVSLDSPRRIRLIDTGNRRERYACLSHCWGGQYPLRTTRIPDTFSAHLTSIEEQSLPKTFRDAITVIVELGIRFIWIDSLCIIQDDKRDWQIQSAQMANIYANSTLTIAASASSGPHEGLFRVAAPDRIGWSISKFPHMRARQPLKLGSQGLPLLGRGWVFQERLLSPRVLHFAGEELIWECMELLDCECEGTEAKPHGTSNVWPVPKNLCHPVKWSSSKDDHVMVTDMWLKLINDYVQLALSNPDDMFPAISGIAKSFGEATGWDYNAGMWKQTMIYCLAWTAQHDVPIRCVPWRAPTFSWASVQFDMKPSFGLSYPDWNELDVSATAMEAVCCSKGDDPTGQLESGYVILSGMVIQATIFDTQNGFRIRTLPPEGANAAVFPFNVDCNLKQAGHEVNDGALILCVKLFDRRIVGKIGLWLILSKKKSTAWEWNGTKGDGEFERIGFYQGYYDEDETNPRTLEQASSEQATQLSAMVKII